jgi:hypothetical protein
MDSYEDLLMMDIYMIKIQLKKLYLII